MLAQLETNLVAVRRVEFERLVLAREWALAHLVTDPDHLADPRRLPTPLGAVGLAVDEYAAAELAAALGIHPLAGRHLMADAVDLEARLPRLWEVCSRGRIEVWVARKIAAATSRLTGDQARWVDESLAEVVGTLPSGRLLRLVEARVVQADQALADRLAQERASTRSVWMSRRDEHGTRTLVVRGEAVGVRRFHGTVNHLAHLLAEHGTPEQRTLSIAELRAEAVVLLANPLAALKLLIGAQDQGNPGEAGAEGEATGGAPCAEVLAEAIRTASAAKVRPTAVLYVHLTPQALVGRGVARAEEIGALTRQQLIEVLGHHQISLRPVIDLNQPMAADCYEVPAAIDERLQLSKPADVFPFATSLSRRLDRDHTVAYQENGPPGQTTEPNLGKLGRHHHRIKTHAGWKVVQDNNRFTWTTPHGRVYLTDHRGTHRARPKTPRLQVVWADLQWDNAA